MTTRLRKSCLGAMGAVWVLLAWAPPLRSDVPPPASRPLTGKIIVLDPGHAVLDEAGHIINPGARARVFGALERDVALSVGAKLVPLLEAQGAKVYMTRTPTNPWRYSLRKRADNRSRAIFANALRAHAYVRLHCDWNRSKKLKGFTIYYYRWGSRSLAKSIERSFVHHLPTHEDNNLHRRSFVSSTAKMPAVLVEMGFLSNKTEGKELGTDAYQNQLAESIADGIAAYFTKK